MADLKAFFDKVVTYSIRSLHLCPNKDLLGLITEDDSVIILRLSHQPKKVASIDESVSIATLCFKPDGTGLALSTTEGLLKVYQLESIQLTLLHEVNLHSSSIPYIKWHTFPRHFPPQHFPIEDYYPLEHIHKIFMDLSIVLAVDIEANISMTINGIYPLALFTENGVQKLALNTQMNKLYVLESVNSELSLQVIDVCIIEKKVKEIQEVAEIFARCHEHLKVVGKASKEVVKEANSATGAFFQKYLRGIQDCIESAGGSTTVEELLCTCAATGIIGSCLNKFIKEEMQNSKAITQYEERLALQVKNCQILLISHCKNSITSLIFYLTTLQNYSQVPKYAPLNLKSLNFPKIIEKLQKLLEKTILTMELLSEAHSNIKNVIHWLHNWNLKLVKEEEQAESPEEWPVDLKQLMTYLDNPSNLMFAKLTKITKSEFLDDFNAVCNDWKEIVKKIPKNLPQYFRKSEKFVLSHDWEANAELEVGENVLVGLFDRGRCQVFEIKVGNLTSFVINPGISIKFISVCEDFRVLVAGGVSGKGVLMCVDKEGKKVVQGDFNNEEVSVMGYSSTRKIAALVTNERTLRIFDFEEV